MLWNTLGPHTEWHSGAVEIPRDPTCKSKHPYRGSHWPGNSMAEPHRGRGALWLSCCSILFSRAEGLHFVGFSRERFFRRYAAYIPRIPSPRPCGAVAERRRRSEVPSLAKEWTSLACNISATGPCGRGYSLSPLRGWAILANTSRGFGHPYGYARLQPHLSIRAL